ncbi:MAG: stage III sporulation protein AB [Oscillospiraceae bacterium]
MKSIGIILIVIMSAMTGAAMADRLSGRYALLCEIDRFVGKAAALIRQTASPLEDIICAAAEDKRLGRLSFLADINRQLDGGRTDIRGAWKDCLENAPPEYIQSEEKALLEELGEMLGSTDVQGQLEGLSAKREALRELIAEADRERREKGKLYRMLGVTAGLFAAVILI